MEIKRALELFHRAKLLQLSLLFAFACLGPLNPGAFASPWPDQCETDGLLPCCARQGPNFKHLSETAQSLQQNSCPVFGADLALVRKGAKLLDCTRNSKVSTDMACWPQDLQPEFQIQGDEGSLGFEASHRLDGSKYFVFYGTRLRGPSLSGAVTADVFRSAEIESSARMIFQQLKENKRVNLFGHSQGGASAQVAAYFAVKKYVKEFKRYPENLLTLVTFGSPGAQEILKDLDPEFDPQLFSAIKKYAIIANGDLVPRINTEVFPSLLVGKNKEEPEGLLNPISVHRIKYYNQLAQSDTLCEAQKVSNKPLLKIKSRRNLLYQVARIFRELPTTVRAVLYDSKKETEQCLKLAEKDRRICMGRLQQFKYEVLSRLKQADPNASFEFNPLADVSN